MQGHAGALIFLQLVLCFIVLDGAVPCRTAGKHLCITRPAVWRLDLIVFGCTRLTPCGDVSLLACSIGILAAYVAQKLTPMLAAQISQRWRNGCFCRMPRSQPQMSISPTETSRSKLCSGISATLPPPHRNSLKDSCACRWRCMDRVVASIGCVGKASTPPKWNEWQVVSHVDLLDVRHA